MTAGSVVESLLELQGHDAAIDRLTHRLGTLPERAALSDAESAARTLLDRLRALTAERDGLAREERRIDDEVGQLREKAKEVEAKMYSGSVTSPRELQAMQADVDQLRRHQRLLEDRELELMEVREPLDRELAELDAQRARILAELNDARAALAASEATIDGELAAERSARDVLVVTLDPTLVREYERRRARSNGVGVARLVGDTCQGCHLAIPATEVERIRKLPEGTIASCDNCGCILVP